MERGGPATRGPPWTPDSLGDILHLRVDTDGTGEGMAMAKPIILTVDDDPSVSQAITRDLRSRYAGRYRIIRATSGTEALRRSTSSPGATFPWR